MNQDKQTYVITAAWEAIGYQCASVEQTGNMAPTQKLIDAMKAVEAELAALKEAPAGNLADVVQTVFDALQDKIDAKGPIAKSNLQLYVNMLRDAFVAELATPQAQDVQDAPIKWPVARTPLSDEQIEDAFIAAGGRWADDSYWVIEDADLHPFVRGITQEKQG